MQSEQFQEKAPNLLKEGMKVILIDSDQMVGSEIHVGHEAANMDSLEMVPKPQPRWRRWLGFMLES